MKVLMISSDKKILEKDSAVRQRMVEYSSQFQELHIIIFNKKSPPVGQAGDKITRKLDGNIWLYPTNSFSKWFYIFDAILVSRKMVMKKNSGWLVTTQDPFETGLAGFVIARLKKAKLHIQIHTDFLDPFFRKESRLNIWRGLVAKFILPRADGVRVVSERIKSSLKTKNLKLKTTPVVLPIFVDIEKIKNSLAGFNLKEKYPQFDFIFLVVSRLEKEKNISLVIEAFVEVVKIFPKAGLVIVGDGSKRKSLELLAKGHKLSANLVFEGWQDDLVSYYKTADMFLSASNYEGYGMTLVESAMAGCPILTTDVGLVGDILTNKDIRICPVGDRECFVENMKKALSNKTLLYDMSVKAQEDVSKRVINNKQQYLEEYKKSLEMVS